MQSLSSTPHRGESVLIGIAAALAAYFLLSVMNMFAKLLGDHHHPLEVGFLRNLIALMPFLLWAVVVGFGRLKTPKLGGIAIRSVIGTISLVVTFAAYIAMPMADTTALLFTSSLLLPVFSSFLLKENVGPWRWGAIVIGFAGVLVMVQPTGAVNATGVALALSAAFLHATLGLILRYLGKTESPMVVTFYFLLIGTLGTSLPMPFVASPLRPELWWQYLGLGLSGALAQFLLATAFRHAQAAVVTVFNYSGIVWATLFGWLIWNDWPTVPV
ncbi:MAG: DMT family transporter, partial [Pseudomonadota bacterium]|nr:DMT family transporter [Pseudomonadota bacterium]